MGKANPNSFNSYRYSLYQNSFINKDYTFLFLESHSVNSLFSFFFSKKTNSIVNHSTFFIDDKNNTVILLLSFFRMFRGFVGGSVSKYFRHRVLKVVRMQAKLNKSRLLFLRKNRRFLKISQKRKHSLQLTKLLKNFKASTYNRRYSIRKGFLVKRLSFILNRLGYSTFRKIFIFRCLNKTGTVSSIKEKKILQFRTELGSFRFQKYFPSANLVTFLVLRNHHSCSLIGNFISKNYRLIYRREKFAKKFLSFLRAWVRVFVKSTVIDGIRIQIKGKFKAASRKSKRVFQAGRIPLQTVSSKVSYSLTHLHTSYGVFGIKIWINKK